MLIKDGCVSDIYFECKVHVFISKTRKQKREQWQRRRAKVERKLRVRQQKG